MKRLVRTSSGWLELDVSHLGSRLLGFSVRAAYFGEGGWASRVESWNSRWRQDEGRQDESLASFLARIAGLPSEEAAQISAELLQEWRESGEEDADRRQSRVATRILVFIVTVALIGWAAVVVAGAVVVWKLLA